MAASAGVSTSGARGRPRRCKCTPKICSRPTRSGLSTETRRSKRPGRSSAGSNTSALQEREEGRSGGGKGSRQGGKRKLRIGPARGGGSLPHLFVAAMQVTTPAPSAPHRHRPPPPPVRCSNADDHPRPLRAALETIQFCQQLVQGLLALIIAHTAETGLAALQEEGGRNDESRDLAGGREDGRKTGLATRRDARASWPASPSGLPNPSPPTPKREWVSLAP